MKKTSGLSTQRIDGLLFAGLTTIWLLVFAFAALFLVRPWPDIVLHIDFSSFWMAALMLRDGAGPALFDMDKQHAFEISLRHLLATSDYIRNDVGYNPYPNLPPLALLYVPLTLLPISWAYPIWWAIGFLSFAVAIAVPLRGHPLGRTVAVCMLSFVAVTTTLFEGQPYGFFLLDFVAALIALRSGRPFLGGLLFGVLWLKPQYAVIFPAIFLIKGRWRELAGSVVSGAVVGAVSLALVGIDGVFAYLRLIQGIGGFHYRWVDPWAMINWRGMILNLWPAVPEDTGSLLVLLLGAATIGVSLLAWRGEWNPSSPRFQFQMLVAVVATLLASPHSHIHGAVLLLAPLALVLTAPHVEIRFARLWVPLLLLGYLLSVAIWPFGLARWVMGLYLLLAMAFLMPQCHLLCPEAEAAGKLKAWKT